MGLEFRDMNGKRITQKEWSALIVSSERVVGFERVKQPDGTSVDVSTVWIGIVFGDDGKRVFETMVFGGVHDGFMARYATRKEAEEGHENVVVLVGGRRNACQEAQKPLF